MSWIRTDAMALACILGSAAAGGAATVALLQGEHGADHRCRVVTTVETPTVVVADATEGDVAWKVGTTSRIVTGVRAPTVVVTSHSGSRADHRCFSELQQESMEGLIELRKLRGKELHLQRLESNLQEMEVQLQGLGVKLEGLDVDIDHSLDAELRVEIQERLQAELEKARVKLEGRGHF